MKKIIIPMIAVSMLWAANAFAGAGAIEASAAGNALQADTPATAAIGRASKNVRYGWNTVSTGYTINTFHTSGTKCYGSGSDSTKIYFKPCSVDDTATTALAPASSVGNTEYVSPWTPM